MTHVVGQDGRLNPLSFAGPLALSLALYYSAAFLPIMGIFAPAPLYYAMVAHGRVTGVYTIITATVATLLLSGVDHSLFFLVSCGLMAWVLADAYYKKLDFETTVAVASIIPFSLGSALLFLSASTDGQGLTAHLSEWGRTTLGSIIETYKSMDVDPEVVTWLEGGAEEFVSMFVTIFPSITIVSIMFMVMMNIFALRLVSLRFGWDIHFHNHLLSRWHIPDWFVWSIVVGGFGSAFMGGVVATVTLNLLILGLAVYSIQGIAVIHFFFVRSKIPVFLLAIGYFLIFSQPLLIGGALVIGLVDVWADFRKLGSPDKPDNNTGHLPGPGDGN
ncbi:hypothetical protein MNBD_NITROSPINAE02-2200 [hydrothermal vent metagenome]|uniref:DUF2232 domain-containing protein n=1 Tax=hydrothermal vent metagenome TaxID=652676 RepID=A0A3B1CUC4_9ZZZZ